MEYFELKLDYKNYSKAYKLYRKEWIEKHIGIIFAVFVIWLAFIFVKGRIRKFRREVQGE